MQDFYFFFTFLHFYWSIIMSITLVLPHLVSSGHELVPGGGAQRLHVVVLQADPPGRQLVQVRRPDLGSVVAHIVPAEVIRQDEHDVRPPGGRKCRETCEEDGHDEPELRAGFLHLQVWLKVNKEVSSAAAANQVTGETSSHVTGETANHVWKYGSPGR